MQTTKNNAWPAGNCKIWHIEKQRRKQSPKSEGVFLTGLHFPAPFLPLPSLLPLLPFLLFFPFLSVPYHCCHLYFSFAPYSEAGLFMVLWTKVSEVLSGIAAETKLLCVF